MAFRHLAQSSRGGNSLSLLPPGFPNVPQGSEEGEPEPPVGEPQVVADEVGDEAWAALAASYDAEDSSAIYASQGSEDPFRRVARKSQFEDMIQMLRENPGRDNTEAGEAELHGDGSPDPDANALRRTNPYEWDFTNKRKVKLTTKQLRKMFSPRQPPGIEVSSPRRTYRRWSEESDPNSEFEELSSFGGDQEDTSWIDEFLSAPARRDSWHAPASLKENQLLRVTNDDLQEACLRGDLGLVKRLINARASVNAPIRPQDADEFMTLLHVLARKPHMQNCSSIIAEMVRNKANLNVRSSLGTTPLSLACHAKHTEAVEVLLRAKASADPIDDYGKKAPLYAILPPWDETLVDNADENLTVKTVQLLARARTNLDDGGDNSPIVESVKLGNFPSVAALLACGVVPTGLHEAVDQGVLDIMDALIIAKANPFLKDKNGQTVMDLALASGDEEVIDTIRDFVGDLRRQDHPHLRMMEENLVEEEELEAKERKEFLEPEEEEEDFFRHKVVVQEETLTEYFAALGEVARTVFKNQFFQGLMLFCLFVALFVADVFIIINVSSDVVLDAVLVFLMAAFLLEFVIQLLAYPRGYTCSFYFWMDLLGILSVPLDHSLVVNALPSGLDSNAVVMRAARMAKLGARAGRFTKLVKLLRFLPFMQQTSSGGTARVISATLNVALSMRVSLLIILMVLVLPLFSLATFPENDFSMRMWVETISDTATLEVQYLDEVLANFTAFYSSSSYFPFQISVDYRNGTVATRSLRSETPSRSRAIVDIQAAGTSTLAAFDFTQPQQVDSICNCVLIVTIVLLMVISALFLSNTVTHIVLTPLEALLDHVHHMAANIFKSMAALGTQHSLAATDEDDEHRNSADAFGTETRLLDQTLKKVIALSKISVKKSPIDSESLKRLGAGGDLMWLQAYSTDAAFGEVMNVNADLLSDAGLQEADVQDLAITIENKMQQVSISWDTFSLWELDTVDLSDKDRQNLNLCLLFSRRATSIRDKTLATPEWLERCGNFLDECQSGYDSGTIAPYHTWLHAVDATYTLYRIMTLIAAEQYLGHLECFGLLVAAIAHDMGHRGRSNVFLVEIGHELAIRYNDIAILENMHCSLLFQILSQDKMNILSELSEPIYNHIRHVIVDAILATDFAQHTGMVKEFESMYGVNSELFDMADEMYMTMDEFPPNELLEYFKTHDVKKSLRTVLLHFSDISNPMKPFPIAEKWAALVLEEFALQGDEEKALGIPMGPLNDRDTVNTPLSQIGFIEFVVAPLALSLARVLPPLWFSNQMILDNANIWMDKWIEGTLLKPSLEEQVNVRERIHRMVQKTEQRGYTATMTALAPPA